MKQMHRPPKYCQGFEDRHGKIRWYYRRKGFPITPLSGLPWSPEFMASYEKAMAGEKIEVGKSKSAPGTVSALVVSYYQTSDFQRLSESTKTTYRGIIERFREEHGTKRVHHMQAQNVKKIIGEKAATPAAANNLLRIIHILMLHAVDLQWRRDDPTKDVKKIRHKSEGFLTWEEHHIEQFTAYHKQGTRAHLALSLLLYTGQRRSDVVRMGRQHVRDGWISIVQQKTGQLVEIPFHAAFKDVLNALPLKNMTFLTTAQGKPFTPAGFTNWFRDMTKEAGLPDKLSPHGLRKAACRRLAEAGCTPHQIMAISGHQSLDEVTRYTVAASRRELATQAAPHLQGGGKSRT
ncbi:tyrosine-type recombinase/integrase [Agrobacterium vitis]|uniref:tyrosine-type recombinase/integrase n=1 Tax=Agrobacterium vitis TaxID=373 RepID=UPI0012E70582|nr:tyrosine-type recombinase/integrase [Agrobacterium vitis]MVA47758.1 tyrosine-type recombinase/integrase [Agrobacterium vitis]